MCGIYCAISHSPHPPNLGLGIENLLRQRGPDHFGIVDKVFEVGDGRKVYLRFAASVLALRREEHGEVVRQPLVLPDDRGLLCWNGEAWKYDGQVIETPDTAFVAERLSEIRDDDPTFHRKTLDILGGIRGPFALIYWNRARGVLYFGRDCVGRRSIVRAKIGDGGVILSSIPDFGVAKEWEEVDADGIYTLDVRALDAGHDVEKCITRTPYATSALNGESSIPVPWPPLNKTIPPTTPPRLTTTSPSVATLLTKLRASLALRLAPNTLPTTKTPVAILFSGGLDCTLLARLAHEILPSDTPIDLLNVAFENPRIHKTTSSPKESYEACPDRQTARQSHAELSFVCPERRWNLVPINIPYAESSAHKSTVQALIHPHDTEMDLSIAMALYFASRGPTSARVLLSGLGADELFGGYQRHYLAFKRGGFAGLLDELELDTQRLGKRNLGRDDRVTAHWGREVRYPFLDEDVIAWAMDAGVGEKVGFGSMVSDEGEGGGVDLDDKLVLRLIARKLGMGKVSTEKKRAIQFGTRSAKMENGRVKGTMKVG